MNSYSIFRGHTGNGYDYTVETFGNALVHRYTVTLHSHRNPQGLTTCSHDWTEALEDLIQLDEIPWHNLPHSQPTTE